MWKRISENTDYRLCEKDDCVWEHPMAEYWRLDISSLDGEPMAVPVDECDLDGSFANAVEAGQFVSVGQIEDAEGALHDVHVTAELSENAELVKMVRNYIGCL